MYVITAQNSKETVNKSMKKILGKLIGDEIRPLVALFCTFSFSKHLNWCKNEVKWDKILWIIAKYWSFKIVKDE